MNEQEINSLVKFAYWGGVITTAIIFAVTKIIMKLVRKVNNKQQGE